MVRRHQRFDLHVGEKPSRVLRERRHAIDVPRGRLDADHSRDGHPCGISQVERQRLDLGRGWIRNKRR